MTAYGRQPTLAGAATRKPEPASVERALADINPERALHVGDSKTDIIAANRAGIDPAFPGGSVASVGVVRTFRTIH